MPSTEEAFGTAYIEAMAAGVPAIGCRGEPGPEEIAAAGGGFLLVPPGDIERLSQRIDELLSDAHTAARGLRPRPRDGQGALHLGALRRADPRRLPGGAGAGSLPEGQDSRERPRRGGRRGAPGASGPAARPVLFVTGHVPGLPRGRPRPPARARGSGGGALRRLTPPRRPRRRRASFPSRYATRARASCIALAASGRYRAVVCPTGGRAALLASWAGARAGRVPVILWASLWAHPRTPAHALSYLPLRRLYRSARRSSPTGPTSAPMCAGGAR